MLKFGLHFQDSKKFLIFTNLIWLVGGLFLINQLQVVRQQLKDAQTSLVQAKKKFQEKEQDLIVQKTCFSPRYEEYRFLQNEYQWLLAAKGDLAKNLISVYQYGFQFKQNFDRGNFSCHINFTKKNPESNRSDDLVIECNLGDCGGGPYSGAGEEAICLDKANEFIVEYKLVTPFTFMVGVGLPEGEEFELNLFTPQKRIPYHFQGFATDNFYTYNFIFFSSRPINYYADQRQYFGRYVLTIRTYDLVDDEIIQKLGARIIDSVNFVNLAK